MTTCKKLFQNMCSECSYFPNMSLVSLLSFWKVSLFLVTTTFAVLCHGQSNYSRYDFPRNFIFGSATSAYQVEGAANEDGRSPSIWDTFAHAGFVDGENADVTCDHYHKYKEDVQLMAEMGLEAYRFSISWSRLIPNGRGPVNPKGLRFYNNLIDELLSHGIQPHVTLVNYDHPQALEDEYDGWVSRKMIKDFVAYADVCFREFGDRVKYWTTVNEPNVFSDGSFDSGLAPPRRCSVPFGIVNCTKGDSTTEPYIVAHHILLAHASTVKLYREKYQRWQSGFVGLTVFTFWYVPHTNTEEDIVATQRANDFLIGWFLDPLVFGDYPESMKKNAGSRIPSFTKPESEMVKGSFDFIGIVHFSSVNVKDNPSSLMTDLRDRTADQAVELIADYDAISGLDIPITPEGLEGVLDYFKRAYKNPPVFVYENGRRMLRNSSLDLEDTERVQTIQAYMGGVLNAIRNGSNARGYFVWSSMDAFELFGGYCCSYGLIYVDFNDPDLKRIVKLSGRWYSEFLKGKSVDYLEQVMKSEAGSLALSS